MRRLGDYMGRELDMDFDTPEQRKEWEQKHAGYAPQVYVDKDGKFGALYKWFGYDTSGDNQAKTYGYNKESYY